MHAPVAEFDVFLVHFADALEQPLRQPTCAPPHRPVPIVSGHHRLSISAPKSNAAMPERTALEKARSFEANIDG